MFCKNCGTGIAKESEFCSECGDKVEKANNPVNQPPPPLSPLNQIPTVGNYIVVQLLAMIPLIGFILMVIWAVGGSTTPLWRRNYARAFFVMIAIGVVLSILMTIAFAGIFMAILDEFMW